MQNELRHLLAIQLTKGVGPKNARILISYCGSAEEVFSNRTNVLNKLPGIGEKTVRSIQAFNQWDRVDQELNFIEEHEIQAIPYYKPNFPNRLTYCDDAPLMLFTNGQMNLDAEKVISIVGTRNASEYGKEMVHQLIETLQPHQPLIISGLAYGIDITAHRTSLNHDLPTVGVVAHGLRKIYPSLHRKTANQMMNNGGVVTEFLSDTEPDKSNFPKRNRIIAGLADATVVVETPKKGGSMITAYLASSYNRDVYAFPGRVNDTNSKGCNHLIKTNIAALIESGDDLAYQLGWEMIDQPKRIQKQLFVELSPNEQKVMDCYTEIDTLEIDRLTKQSQLTLSQVLSELLNLEFKGMIKSLPGKRYKII